MTRLICMLHTPQDDRFSASGVVTLAYTTDETEKTVRNDAVSILERGQREVDEMMEEGCLTLETPIGEGCYIPEGFPVTIEFPDGRITQVTPNR